MTDNCDLGYVVEAQSLDPTYSKRCEQVLKVVRKRLLGMPKCHEDFGCSRNYLKGFEPLNSMADDTKHPNFSSCSNCKVEESCFKENKVKRSLNVCLLQNNGCVTERNDRTLKRARRSLSEKSSDNGYDSFLDDVIPLQNLRLSDSDDDLEAVGHKFSMEQKFSDFELYIEPDKTDIDREINDHETDQLDNLSIFKTKQIESTSCPNVSDELDSFYSPNSETWHSSTPSQKTTSSSQSTFFNTSRCISPISDTCRHRGSKLMDLQEDMEECIRLEAKSMSIIFQHEAKHADTEEKSPRDYDDFLMSKDSDIPSEIYLTESEDEDCNQVQNIEQEQMSCSEILDVSQVNSECCSSEKDENTKQKGENKIYLAPLLSAKVSESIDTQMWKLKPNLWSTPLRPPQRRTVKTVVPLLEMVQRAVKADQQRNCPEVHNSSSANSSQEVKHDELNETNVLREPISCGMLFLSLPYSIPPKRKFEQLLCPLLSNYYLQTKCKSPFQ